MSKQSIISFIKAMIIKPNTYTYGDIIYKINSSIGINKTSDFDTAEKISAVIGKETITVNNMLMDLKVQGIANSLKELLLIILECDEIKKPNVKHLSLGEGKLLLRKYHSEKIECYFKTKQYNV